MSNSIGTLVIDLAMNVAKMQADMSAVQRQVEGGMKRIEGAVNLAKSAFVALGGAVSVGALVSMAKNVIDTGEALHDLSITTGASVEALSAFAEIGKTTDTSAQDIAGAMNKLAKNMAVANEESKGTGQALKALGIDFDTFKKLKPEDQMLEIAKRMNEFEDGAGKSALAMTLFGKSGAQMLPFFKDLANAQSINATMTAEQAARADEFNDSLAQLKMRFDAFVRTVVLDALPVLLKLLDLIGGAVKIFAAYLTLMIAIPAAITAVTTAWKSYVVAQAAASAAAEMFGAKQSLSIIAGLKGIIAQVGLLKIALGGLFIAFAAFQLAKWAWDNFEAVRKFAYSVQNVLSVAWENVKYAVKVAWTQIKMTIAATVNDIKRDWAGMIDAIGRGLQALGAKQAGEAMRAYAAEIQKGIASGREYAIELDRLRREHDKSVDAIHKHTAEQNAAAEAFFKQKKAAEQATKVLEWDGNAKGDNAEKTKQLKDEVEKLSDATLVYTKRQLEDIEVTAERIETVGGLSPAYERFLTVMSDVSRSLSDALFRAFEDGKGFADAFWQTLKNAANTLVLKPTIDFVIRNAGKFAVGVGQGIMPVVSSAASAVGKSAGGSSIGSSLAGIGGLAGAGSMLGAGLGYGLAAWGSGATLAGTLSGAGAMLTAGSLGSVMAGIGAVVGALGPIALGIALLVKGFTRGPKQVYERGVEGDVVEGDFSGQSYKKWKQAGSWFVSGRKGIKYGQLDEDMALALQQTSSATFIAVRKWAEVLKLPGEKLEEVNYKLSFKLGKTDEETEKNITAAFDSYRDALAARFAAVLEPFRQAGETLSETLQRLVNLQQVSEGLNAFGGVFARIARLSVEAKEELIGFAGGIEQLIEKAQSFVGTYYSQEEQTGISAKGIVDALTQLGIDPASLITKEDFRALVEGTDVGTTEGRKLLNSLLDLAPGFAALAEVLGTEGGTLLDLAAKAPQTEILGSLLDETKLSLDYQEQTASGVQTLDTTLNDVGTSITDSITQMREELTAGLVAIANFTQQTATQLARWDNNGQLSTTTDVP